MENKIIHALLNKAEKILPIWLKNFIFSREIKAKKQWIAFKDKKKAFNSLRFVKLKQEQAECLDLSAQSGPRTLIIMLP